MKIVRFEDIDAWKEARRLVSAVYTALATSRDYGFRDQIQRAAVSVMSNIAEGFDRGSNKEFIQFLLIARGSVAEVRSLLYAGLDIGHLEKGAVDQLIQQCQTVSGLLNGFIKYLKNSQ